MPNEEEDPYRSNPSWKTIAQTTLEQNDRLFKEIERLEQIVQEMRLEKLRQGQSDQRLLG